MRTPTALLLLPLTVQAADTAAPVQVAAAPLSRCLEQIAATTGARFIVSPQLAREAPDCRSVAVATDAAMALDAAFEDADLRWHLRDDGVFLLARNDAQPAGTLETLTVEDDADTDDRSLATDPEAPLSAQPVVADLATRTTYDAAELAVKPLLRFNQLGRLAPNVYSSGQSLSIRGVPRDNDYFTGNGVWLDGIEVGTLLLDHNLLAVDDLARLDYQRSAAGFTRGAGHAGGAITLTTPDPSPEFGARFAASGGERSAWSARASATGGLFDGLSGRITLNRREDPRFVRSAVVPALSGDLDQRESAHGKLLFEPEWLPGLTVGVTAFRIVGDAPDRSVARPGIGVDFDLFNGISFDRSALDWDLESSGRGVRAAWDRGEGRVVEAWGSGVLARRDALTSRGRDGTNQRADREDRARWGASIVHPLGEAWSIYAGLERQLLDRSNAVLREVNNPPINGVAYRSADTNRLLLDNTALTTELSWRDGPWMVAAGVRRVDEVVRFRIRERFDPITGTPTDRITVATRSDYSRNLPSAAAEYQFSEQQSLGANWGRSWRSGGFSEFRVIGEYPPERLDTGELFWRARWMDGRLGTRVAAFRTDWRDRTSIDGTIGAEIIEPWRTRIDGVELEFDAALGEAWTLRGGLGWLDARHVGGAYRLSFAEFDLDGQRANDAPRSTALLGLQWRGPRGWHAGIDAYHAGAAESATFVAAALGEAVPLRRDAYTVVDARFGWQGESLSIALIATNLLDEEYIDRFVERRAFSRVIGEPRQLELTIGWTF